MAKRFYQMVSLDQDETGHFVRLDGRVLKTPGKKPVRVPSAEIAALVKEEWDAVPAPEDGEINPSLMPVTRLANVVSEGVSDRREILVAEARNYAGTDLLSYRAPDPAEFVARQSAAWDPWIEWAKDRDIVLETTDSIRAIDQPEASLGAVADYASELPDFSLVLFVHLTAVYGSSILAMAVMEQALEPRKAFDLSRLDELYRTEIWGADEDDEQARNALREETGILGGLVPYLSA